MPARRLRRIGRMTPRRSRAWALTFRAAYAFIRLTDPLLRWTWFSVGIGITSRLSVRGRRSGRERSVLVGLVRVKGAWYVGHPNGEVAWTANLRDAVILATAEQQPFPANLLYRGARRHILSEGRYFRLKLR